MKQTALRPTAESESGDLKVLSYCENPHPLHVRRTLDQYYYHAMDDTNQRDSDQVVSRYQKDSLDPKVITMVDQLWLWVIAGDNGRPDTVLTCFPHREKSARDLADPDPYDFTDVMTNIKSHLLAGESSVKTAYDLAGIIASQCSRAYLDIGSMDKTPGFAEMYETAISNMVSGKPVAPFLITSLTENEDAERSGTFR